MWFRKTPPSTSNSGIPGAADAYGGVSGAESAPGRNLVAREADLGQPEARSAPRPNSGAGVAEYGDVPQVDRGGTAGISTRNVDVTHRRAVAAGYSVIGRNAVAVATTSPIREMDDASTSGIQARMQALPDWVFARLANELTVAFRFEQLASALAAHATSMVRQQPMAVIGLLRESELRAGRAASIWWSPIYQVMLTEVARRWQMRPEQYGAVLYLAPDPVGVREQIESHLPTLVLEALPHLGTALHRAERKPEASYYLEEHLGITQAFVGKHDFAAAFDTFMQTVG